MVKNNSLLGGSKKEEDEEALKGFFLFSEQFCTVYFCHACGSLR